MNSEEYLASISLNEIENYIFQLDSKLYHSMIFKIIFFNIIKNHIFEWIFNVIYIYKTTLYLAVEKENNEIANFLLYKSEKQSLIYFI